MRSHVHYTNLCYSNTSPKTALKLSISPPPPADSSSATPLPSKSRINTVCLSEGDTITEEETYPNTVIDNLADASYATTTTTTEPTTKLDVLPAQKLATIMRSRNRLDRSVLSKCTHLAHMFEVHTFFVQTSCGHLFDTRQMRARAHTDCTHSDDDRQLCARAHELRDRLLRQ